MHKWLFLADFDRWSLEEATHHSCTIRLLITKHHQLHCVCTSSINSNLIKSFTEISTQNWKLTWPVLCSLVTSMFRAKNNQIISIYSWAINHSLLDACLYDKNYLPSVIHWTCRLASCRTECGKLDIWEIKNYMKYLEAKIDFCFSKSA